MKQNRGASRRSAFETARRGYALVARRRIGGYVVSGRMIRGDKDTTIREGEQVWRRAGRVQGPRIGYSGNDPDPIAARGRAEPGSVAAIHGGDDRIGAVGGLHGAFGGLATTPGFHGASVGSAARWTGRPALRAGHRVHPVDGGADRRLDEESRYLRGQNQQSQDQSEYGAHGAAIIYHGALIPRWIAPGRGRERWPWLPMRRQVPLRRM